MISNRRCISNCFRAPKALTRWNNVWLWGLSLVLESALGGKHRAFDGFIMECIKSMKNRKWTTSGFAAVQHPRDFSFKSSYVCLCVLLDGNLFSDTPVSVEMLTEGSRAYAHLT